MMKKGIYSVRMMWLRKVNFVGWFRIRHVCEFREMVDDSRLVVQRMTRFFILHWWFEDVLKLFVIDKSDEWL